MKLDDVLTEDERLDLWAEMMALSAAIQEYCNWWWSLDEGMRNADERRYRRHHRQDPSKLSE